MKTESIRNIKKAIRILVFVVMSLIAALKGKEIIHCFGIIFQINFGAGENVGRDKISIKK